MSQQEKKHRGLKNYTHIPLCAGVYQISTPSGRYYIGHASNLRGRAHSHYQMMRSGQHHNERVQRSWEKYGNAIKFKVLHECTSKQDAAVWEAHYLQMFFDDENCMNAVREDFGTATKNQEYFSKRTYLAHLPTGNIHVTESRSYWPLAFGFSYPYQWNGNKYLIPCKSRQQAESMIGWYLLEQIRKESNKRKHQVKRPERLRCKHLYFIWTKTRKWIVWGSEQAKEITSGIDSEYWIKTRTRNWKHKKPLTKPVPVRLWREDRGEIMCASIGEACRVIGCSHMEVLRVLERRGRRTTYGWTIEKARPGIGC